MTESTESDCIANLQRARQNAPDDPDLGSRLATAFTRQHRLHEAKSLLESLLGANPHDPGVLRAAIWHADALGSPVRMEELIARLERVVALPAYELRVMHFRAGWLANKRMRRSDAVALADGALPDGEIAGAAMALSLAQFGDLGLRLLDAHPDSGGATHRIARGYALADCGRTDEAIRLARSLTTENAFDPERWLLLASASHTAGDYGTALIAVERVMDLAPEIPTAYWMAGEAAMKQWRPELATQWVARGLQKCPESERLRISAVIVLFFRFRLVTLVRCLRGTWPPEE